MVIVRIWCSDNERRNVTMVSIIVIMPEAVFTTIKYLCNDASFGCFDCQTIFGSLTPDLHFVLCFMYIH